MSEPEEPGATEDVSAEPAASSEAGERTGDAPKDDQAAPADTTQPPEGQTESEPPVADNRPAEQSPGEDTTYTPAGIDTQDPAVTDVTNEESVLAKQGQEPTEEEQVSVVAAGLEAEVASSQEPGTAPVDNTSGESAARDFSEEGGPSDISDAAKGQQDIAETNATVETTGERAETAGSEAILDVKTTPQGEEGEEKAGTEAEVAPGSASAEEAISEHAGNTDEENKSDADTAVEGKSETAEHGEEAEEGSDPSSAAGEPGQTPGSAGSTSQEDEGRSLTKLVERSSLEQQHRALLLLRRQLLARSQRVQQRLSQHFSRKTDDAADRVEKNVGELEARYSRYLSGIREQQRTTAEERERRQQELAAFRAQVEQQTELVSAAYNSAVEMRHQVALKSRSSRTGRLMGAAEVEALIGREQQKELEVQEARLESLRRETRLSRLEQTLRESEELAGGIHLIDFEQLKIENQTYAEKIEERNEDLTKLRRKISSTVQILTHLKERIQFEQAENERRQRHLQTVSAEVTHGRESLAQLKQRRDQVRSRTAGQRATAGLLGHEALLRDFEARVDEEARLVRELQALKRDYADHQRVTQAIRQMVRTRKQQQQGKPRSADRH